MRFKLVISVLPANLRLFWERITASRIATLYFAFSILNCVLQVVFQAQAFSANARADNALSTFIRASNGTGRFTLPTGFFVLDSKLHLCEHVPRTISTKSCLVVWSRETGGNSTKSVTSLTPTSTTSFAPTTTAAAFKNVGSQSPHDNRSQLDLGGSHQNTSSNDNDGVEVVDENGTDFTLDGKCLVNLAWFVQTLNTTKREDVTFLAFQFWVLGMSIVALLNESIPHIIAAVLTHLSSTAWGGFQIYDTRAFHSDFQRLTTDGPCHVNLLPGYWPQRSHAEIPSLAFNIAALFLSCFLSFKLIKLFGWQTFKRVGASRSINRMYKLVLTLSIVIQLSLFFVVAAVIIWLDQLYNGAIAVMSPRSNLYQVVLTLVITLVIPWLLTGWFAARKEMKLPMIMFLVLSALYLVGLGVMFDSRTFRWTFVTWGFFAAMVSLSAGLILIGLIVGIMCRMNFDKGLVQYLNGEEPIQEGTFIQRVPDGESFSEEKVDFPSTRHPIPTYSASFDSNNLPGSMGPRFFNQSAVPFDRPVDTESGASSYVDHSMQPTSPLSRNVSELSTSSQASSIMTMNAPSIGRSRWVIE